MRYIAKRSVLRHPIADILKHAATTTSTSTTPTILFLIFPFHPYPALPLSYAPTPGTETPPAARLSPLLLGPTKPCLCLPVLPLPNQLYLSSLLSLLILSCASSLDCNETRTETHCSILPTVSVTFVLSMGVWRKLEGALL